MAFKISGDAGTYLVVQQPSTPLPQLRVFSLAGTLALNVRLASDVLRLSEPNCVFGVVDEPKQSVRVRGVSGASRVKQHHVVMQERLALIATQSIEDGEEMLLSSSSLVQNV